MNIMTFILTTTMIWIVVFFLMLPFSVKMPKKVKIGNSDSAPEVHYLGYKILISFLLSVVLAIIYWYIFYGRFSSL